MSTDPATSTRLRRISQQHLAGEPVSADDASWFAELIENQERAAEANSLDAAARRRIRDDALRSLADQFFPKLSINARATAIRSRLNKYETSATWSIDRRSERMPSHYAGTMKGFLFMALKAGPIPRGERQLRVILSTAAKIVGSPPIPTANKSSDGFGERESGGCT
jgi:hypothetical protein